MKPIREALSLPFLLLGALFLDLYELISGNDADDIFYPSQATRREI